MNLRNFVNEGKVVLNNGLAFFFSTKFLIKDETPAWEKEARTGPKASKTPSSAFLLWVARAPAGQSQGKVDKKPWQLCGASNAEQVGWPDKEFLVQAGLVLGLPNRDSNQCQPQGREQTKGYLLSNFYFFY